LDPEVVDLWLNGDFTLGQPTHVAITDSKSIGTQLGVTGNSTLQVSGNVLTDWERQQGYMRESVGILIEEVGENNLKGAKLASLAEMVDTTLLL
jgi:hypothetical protein